MKQRTVLMLLFSLFLAAALALTLWREVTREEQELGQAITGVVEVSPALMASGRADIVRTDRLVLFLVDPATRQPVALRFLSPLTPPQTYVVGAKDGVGDAPVTGDLLLVGISDKDGEIFKVTPGEVYGRMATPLPLGSERVRLVLDQPFRGSLFNEPAGRGGGNPIGGEPGAPPAERPAAGMATPLPGKPRQGGKRPEMGPARPLGAPVADPAHTISGTIRVAEGLQGSVEVTDRLVILLFPAAGGPPAAFRIVPHFYPPQRFSITVPPGRATGDAYSLRVVTDKNGNPPGAAPGELVGRSQEPIPLGTADLDFVLDQPFTGGR